MNSFSSGLPMVNPSRAALLALEGLIESSVFLFTNAAEAAAEAMAGLAELLPDDPSAFALQPPAAAPAVPPQAASDTD
eukprot:1574035-Pleurochrysis_carterae.AAC.1